MTPEPRAEPIEAWKDLVLTHSEDEGIKLSGPFYKEQKYTLENVKATCYAAKQYAHTAHDAPDPTGQCLCGFNAYKEKRRTKVYSILSDSPRSGVFFGQHLDNTSINVSAKVLLYGRVVEYQEGFRAEYQDIEAIYLQDWALNRLESRGINLVALKNDLQCDVVPVRSNWVIKGEDTDLQVRLNKNGNAYVYVGYQATFRQDLLQKQPQIRAYTIHFNPNTLTVSVLESWQVQQKRKADGELVYPCSPRMYLYRHGVWLRKYNGKFICAEDPKIAYKANGQRLDPLPFKKKKQYLKPSPHVTGAKGVLKALDLLKPFYPEAIEKFRKAEAVRYVKKDCQRRLLAAGALDGQGGRMYLQGAYTDKMVCTCGKHEGDRILSYKEVYE